jgi:alpha-galactosidase
MPIGLFLGAVVWLLCGMAQATDWLEKLADTPYVRNAGPGLLEVERQDAETMKRNASVIGTPLRLGGRTFDHGLGTHANSVIRIAPSQPVTRFTAWIGVDNNERTGGERGSVVFYVLAEDAEIYRSPMLTAKDPPLRVDLAVGGAHSLALGVTDAGDGIAFDHADWADSTLTLEGGTVVRLDELTRRETRVASARYPFSFTYGGASSDELLGAWQHERQVKQLDANRHQTVAAWTDPETGLRVTWELVRYSDFPAADWLLYFENAGGADTPIIACVQAMDVVVGPPMSGPVLYRMHALRGGVPNPVMFEPLATALKTGSSCSIGAGSGRSSAKNMPFYRVDTGAGAYVCGIEWSGNWTAAFEAGEDGLRMQAGMEKTHFVLHPGERVRTPRVLVLDWEGERSEANAQFRQLVYEHYALDRSGQRPQPVVFCNTCFTRGGGWLNETTADNQISLINAYAPLGLEALLTDAGWFEGGWPEGAGNWTPRKDHYPDGMGPVAQAAKDKGMIYGLWFEPERVMAGTALHLEHPEWLLSAPGGGVTYLANFALKEVQDYFFEIVKGFMELPGFRVYRQDFNMDPLPYWSASDAEDRQGVSEMHYVEGLYAYWERIHETWPDALMEECASGGHRIDLGTVMRMHVHQKSDYWFDDEADNASLFAVSAYLPNNVIAAHLRELDDYSFHSTLASSLCLGWIADDPAFDAARGKALLERYREVRHLLVGAWYPLFPYPHDYYGLDTAELRHWLWDSYDQAAHKGLHTGWVGSQFHRPDLDEGMLLVFRRTDSPYRTATVELHDLDRAAAYELTSGGSTERRTGAELMDGLELTIDTPRESKLITYRKVE